MNGQGGTKIMLMMSVSFFYNFIRRARKFIVIIQIKIHLLLKEKMDS